MKKWIPGLLLLALLGTACSTKPATDTPDTVPTQPAAQQQENEGGDPSNAPAIPSLTTYAKTIEAASKLPGVPKAEIEAFAAKITELAKIIDTPDAPFPDKVKAVEELNALYTKLAANATVAQALKPVGETLKAIKDDLDTRDKEGDPSAPNDGKASPSASDNGEASPAAQQSPQAQDKGSERPAVTIDKQVTSPTGLKYTVKKAGKANGKLAEAGKMAVVHYTGTLTDGTKFDSSRDRNQPFEFMLGEGRVITGWDEGVNGMVVGERRILVVPADLGYGAQGAPPVIPQNSELIFDVELLDVK